MKVIALVVIALLASQAVAQRHPNLVAEYRLDGNANDTSGNNLHATSSNVQWGSGLGSLVALFDDTPPGSIVTRTNLTMTANMTFTAWFRRSWFNEQGYIYAHSVPLTERRINSAIKLLDEAVSALDMGIYRDVGIIGQATNLTHVAMQYVGTNIFGFVNGAAIGQNSYTGPIDYTAAPFHIGGRSGTHSTNAWLNGAAGRLRIYNRVLDANDIRRDRLGFLPMRRYP